MIEPQVDFKTVKEWYPREIVDLYRSAGWWEEYYDQEEIPSLIRGSFIFVIGINRISGEAVSMGRILSDTIRTGYIHDLCVLPHMRGRHIGSEMLRFLVHAGMEAGLMYFYLIAEPGTMSFYEKAGFSQEQEKIFLKKSAG